MAGGLRGAGAEVLAMPCNTAHAHAAAIREASGLPLIDMIGEAVAAARASGARSASVCSPRQWPAGFMPSGCRTPA